MDPTILAVFGQPPTGLDLAESKTMRDDSVVVILSIQATLAVIGRIYARRIKKAPLWLDDILVFFALILELASMVLTIWGGRYGAGKHVWTVDLLGLKSIFRILYGYMFIYGATTSALKLSFVLYYARIFHTGRPVDIFKCRDYISIAVLVGGALACAYPIMVWGVMLGACKPIHYFWDQYSNSESGSCVDTTLFYLLAGIINMVIDILILLIPVPCILRLQVKRSDKIMLFGIFMIGGFVCVASAMRIGYLQVFRTSIDVTFYMGNFFIWCSVEPAVGITASCLISLRPLFAKLRHMVSSRISTNTSAQSKSRDQQYPVYDGRRQDDEVELVQGSVSSEWKRPREKGPGIKVETEIDIHR